MPMSMGFPVYFDRLQFSLINLGVGYLGYGDMPAFRVLRTLRGLRPLRAMSRMQGLKVSGPSLQG